MQGSCAPTAYGLHEILIYTNTVPIEITQLIFGGRIPLSGFCIGYIEYPHVVLLAFSPSGCVSGTICVSYEPFYRFATLCVSLSF